MADTNGPKPGSQSTEFYLSMAAMVMPLAQTLTGQLPPETAALIVSAVASIYTAARMIVKSLHAYGLAKSIPDLPAQAGGIK